LVGRRSRYRDVVCLIRQWRRFSIHWRERELYDHQHHPQENVNCVENHPAIVGQLSQRLARTLDTGPIELRGPFYSKQGGEPVQFTWINRYDGTVRITWINPMGHRKNAFELQAGQRVQCRTRIGHVFAVESLDGQYHESIRIAGESCEVGNKNE
jgi:iduronate 2-sulfatase